MRPFSKFGIYFCLVGILILLFGRLPHSRSDSKDAKPAVERKEAPPAAEPQTLHVPGPVVHFRENTSGRATPQAAATLASVRAIRGANDYGWIQLPHGTLVDLVRNDRGEMWIRWDGNLFRIDPALAASGAVVLKPAAKSTRG
jgi:hypothetical protein